MRLVVSTLLAVVSLTACGGGGPRPPTSPPPTQPPPNPTQNPCATALLEEPSRDRLAPDAEARRLAKRARVDDTGRWAVLDSLSRHRMGVERGLVSGVVGVRIQDVGDVSVAQDEGDVILQANRFDLGGAGLRFTPNAGGGYDVSRIDAAFRATLGSRLTLQDDDSAAASVPFAFRFYGRGQAQAFVNSDGNVTFEEEDKASTSRDVARLLAGPPRVALFLADLDPTTGGRVFLRTTTEEFTVTWCGVKGFELEQSATIQATLSPSGVIDLKYSDTTTLTEAVIGLSPGRTGTFAAVDLSAGSGTAATAVAIGERFSATTELDTVALARKFYQSHADRFDQLVIWSDVRVLRERAFAVEITVANEIRGIGVDVFDASREFGSGGALRSLVVMDRLDKYPDDPAQRFLGEDSTVSLLGQESGHRWLAFLKFRDHNNITSSALLGRDQAHWSFFFDSDASVMEGNDIEDLGGGSFRTTAAVERYSRLDQYAMGLVDESLVPPFFYVEAPANVNPPREADSAPRVGVTFNGTRRDVLIQDVITAMGARVPRAADSSRVHRQAFIYVVSAGRTAAMSEIDKVDRFRRAWTTFFSQATEGRARAETRLNPGS